MTVKELIKKLMEYYPDEKVFIYDEGGSVVYQLGDCYLDDGVILETGQLA